jgi:hypothetical protein
MKFNKELLIFKGEEVFYDDIKLKVTRQNVQDYVIQTDMKAESIIMFYYKKELDQIRDKQLEQILNDRERRDKMD